MPPSHSGSDARRRLADTLGEAAPEDRIDAAWAAYEEARIAGLCHEGAWEVALGAATPARPLEHPIAPRQSST